MKKILLLVVALCVSALSQAQTVSCPDPSQIYNPVTKACECKPGDLPTGLVNTAPRCYTPLPPEWTPRLAFYISTMPNAGGSVPDPAYIPPIKPGEVFITVPILWDIYQSQAANNPNFAYHAIRGGLRAGDTWLAHLSNGLCFIVVRHQTPVPDQSSLQSVAGMGDGSAGGGATSINGTKAACATPTGGTAGHYTGDVTIELH